MLNENLRASDLVDIFRAIFTLCRRSLHTLSKLWLQILCGVSVLLLNACVDNKVHKPQHSWRQYALIDIFSIHNDISNHHPGPLDAAATQFNTWLEQGKREALQQAETVTNQADYQRVIKRYINGFQDRHLGVGFYDSPKPQHWPGFLLEYRDRHYRVAVSAHPETLPKVGDTLLGCDGLTAAEFYQRNQLPYDGIINLESSQALNAPSLMLDDHSRFITAPKNCRFENSEKTYAIALQWQYLNNAAFKELYKRLLPNAGERLTLERLKDGGYWLYLPTFALYEKPQINETEAFLQSLQRASEAIRNAPYVVLDLRGNAGGHAKWGIKIVETLWSGAYIVTHIKIGGNISYRNSQGNIAHFEHLRDHYDINDAWMQELIDTMKANTGQPLTTITHADAAIYDNKIPNPLKAPVFLLTDYHCFSACLIFADVVLSLPKVYHVGLPTSADTHYSEVRALGLPSEKGVLTIPTVAHPGRARGDNQAYTPQMLWRGDINDTYALRRWIRSLL